MTYMMINPMSNDPQLEECDADFETVRIWQASTITDSDIQFLQTIDAPDVIEFLTSVDCLKVDLGQQIIDECKELAQYFRSKKL